MKTTTPGAPTPSCDSRCPPPPAPPLIHPAKYTRLEVFAAEQAEPALQLQSIHTLPHVGHVQRDLQKLARVAAFRRGEGAGEEGSGGDEVLAFKTGVGSLVIGQFKGRWGWERSVLFGIEASAISRHSPIANNPTRALELTVKKKVRSQAHRTRETSNNDMSRGHLEPCPRPSPYSPAIKSHHRRTRERSGTGEHDTVESSIAARCTASHLNSVI